MKKSKLILASILAALSFGVFAQGSAVIRGEASAGVYENIKSISGYLMRPPILQFKQGDAGTVGSVATLAASTSVGVQFDIGVNWQQYNLAICTIYAGGSTTMAYYIGFGDTLGANTFRGTSLAGVASYISGNISANGPYNVTSYIGARYVYLNVQNLDAVNAFTGGNWFCNVRS